MAHPASTIVISAHITVACEQWSGLTAIAPLPVLWRTISCFGIFAQWKDLAGLMARAQKPAKSLRSAEHRAFCALLMEARRKAGLKQSDVAKKLGIPQSYVAKYEGGERRVNVVEFIAVCDAIAVDPLRVIRALMRSGPRS
jgi:DNA-binding transcriptional regulator YiaG